VNFFKKNKVKLLMLSPILLGLLFFLYSVSSAFYTVNTTKLPKNFDDLSLEIDDYQIQQIDEKNNSVKWVLRALKAKIAADKNSAEIINPKIKFFDSGKQKFTIDGKKADLDKAKQEIVVSEDVVLKTSDKKIQVLTNKMFFSEANPFVEFADDWKIINDKGYEIAGDTGKLSKTQDLIVSIGNASLLKAKDNLKITAEEITLDLKSTLVIRAKTNSTLHLDSEKKLYANNIDINTSGAVRAQGSVKVKTPDLECYSESMRIIPKANKKPKTAIFEGKPYVVQQGNKLYADLIRYDFDSQEAILEGSIHSG
jgi:LPS export ABC transporter protein LptC